MAAQTIETDHSNAVPPEQSVARMPACSSCRDWRRRDSRWGRCVSLRTAALVDGDGGLMTRTIFACRLWRPNAPSAADRTTR